MLNGLKIEGIEKCLYSSPISYTRKSISDTEKSLGKCKFSNICYPAFLHFKKYKKML